MCLNGSEKLRLWYGDNNTRKRFPTVTKRKTMRSRIDFRPSPKRKRHVTGGKISPQEPARKRSWVVGANCNSMAGHCEAASLTQVILKHEVVSANARYECANIHFKIFLTRRSFTKSYFVPSVAQPRPLRLNLHIGTASRG